ncbi:MAG TPA: hypothetical protein VHO84_04290 [Syntrophorhabdaceae bacterium]|nr:hypothetical protein [Syntrophorhabdaceae bacterium]
MEVNPDSTLETETRCQIFSLPQASLRAGIKVWFTQIYSRMKRIGKRRYIYVKNLISSVAWSIDDNVNEENTTAVSATLQQGDVVRIRSRGEIQSTLNNWNQLKGCAFMEEMWPYCGTRHKVLKQVKTFLDERDYSTKKCKGIVVLEGLICEGTKDFGVCDRSCHFFWREEWLEKIDVSPQMSTDQKERF